MGKDDKGKDKRGTDKNLVKRHYENEERKMTGKEKVTDEGKKRGNKDSN